jgi:hypothetical protein
MMNTSYVQTDLNLPTNNADEILAQDLNEQQIDNLLQAVSQDSLSIKNSVCQSLSTFLDEANVSMMGGWT